MYTMRIKKNKTDLLMSIVEKLPYFDFKSLNTVEENKHYLKVFVNRYKKKGLIISLKKGLYTTSKFLDNNKNLNYFDGVFASFNEFVANILYQPSYLSLEYVLAENNILTEVPFGFTSITKNKTAKFKNHFGWFFYHKIKDSLFCGFETKIKYDKTVATVSIYKATKSKALFDFLYLRKNKITDAKSIEELRLNLGNLNKIDIREFKSYVKLEGSKKMKDVYNYLFESNDGN